MIVPARTPGSGADGHPSASSDGVPVAPPAVVGPPSTVEIVDGAVAGWRAALVEAAGGSTLSDVDLLGEAALDLSAAHPSGIAQLFAGRETRLSNLVREGAALATAKRRARAVGARAEQYAQRYGIAPTYLAIGVATWVERNGGEHGADDVAALASVTREPSAAVPGQRSAPTISTQFPAVTTQQLTPEHPAPRPPAVRTVRAPVLLRPVAMRVRGSGGSDYELSLEPSLEVNPVLARALRGRGALLDPVALARGAFAGSGFDPRTALDRLSALGEAILEDFELVERLVVGTFVHPGQVLVDDLDQLAGTLDRHEVVAALAGDHECQEALQAPLPERVRGDRDPAEERGVGDLDAAQQHVLDVLASGAHLFIDAPAGCDIPGTVAAIVSDAAAHGRSVLYVPGHRRAAAAIASRMADLGLDDLVLDVAPDAGWRTAAARRLLGAMTLEATEVDPGSTEALRRDLVMRREQLRGYVSALHAPRSPWGASAYDALQALAQLSSTRPAPSTTVRLAPDVARVMDPDRRGTLAGDLARAASLGAFTVRPGDTPWFGADLRTDADAERALAQIDTLLTTGLPTLSARIAHVAEATGLSVAVTVHAWVEQLHMLAGIRGALDTFQPMIFERTAADLVAATAGKAWRQAHGIEMGRVVRRRLRRQARDMVRPGRPVADLHAALVEVQKQRTVWQAHCPAGGWPRLPEGLAAIEAECREVVATLDALEPVLAGTPAGGNLQDLPLDALLDRLRRLQTDRVALTTLPERTALLHSLRSAGLGDLLDDLQRRRVGAAMVGVELELAWWSGVFEQILSADPALAGYDGNALGRLSAEYQELDRAHVAGLATPVRNAVIAQVGTALRNHREQSEALFAELVEERLTSLRETVTRYPDLVRHLRPVLMAAPMLVPQVLPANRTVDVVVLDAVQHLPLEVALAAIARGRQVVVVGDARCASGSAVRELAAVLPRVALRADATRRDPHLTAFLADHGYDGVLSPTPLPQSEPLVRLDVVPGTGMPDATTGSVDSTRAEVDHVVDLVISHALTNPDESLAVITPSAVHADHVREAVLAEVRNNPALAAFFDAARPEPFVVADLAGVAGLRRDAIVLSVGFGRTPHGRVLHRFGPLSGPGGEALLLDALGATRHRLGVVSCFGAEDLDPERLRGGGSRLLADLLVFAAARGGAEEASDSPAARRAHQGVSGTISPDDGVDRLVLDLAERLWRHGLTVEVDYGLPGGTRIPLAVGHPDLPGELLVAVLTDDAAYVAEPSVRVRDRKVADRLTALGWSVIQVWSAAAFLDPQAEVDRIRRVVHEQVDARPRMEPVPTVAEMDGGRPEVPVDEVVEDVVPPTTGADVEAPTAGEVAEPAATSGEAEEPRAAGPRRPGGRVSVPPVTRSATAEQPVLPFVTGPRPPVEAGLPIRAYTDDQLDDLLAWIQSDGVVRDREQLARALRADLGVTRRNAHVDAVIGAAVRRALG